MVDIQLIQCKNQHSIKTVSGKVVAQSIAFRVVSILAGRRPLPLKCWLQATYALLKATSFDTFCLVTPQPQEIEQEDQHPLTAQRAANFRLLTNQ